MATTERTVNLALLQSACGKDPVANRLHTTELIEKAAGNGAQVILLQELFQTLYFCREYNQDYFDWAEPIPGPTVTKMQEVAAKHDVVLVVPLFERRAPGVYHNSLAVIDADGSLLGSYRKMHIPDDPGFYEKYYFTPGDKGYQVFETKYLKIGPLICWDQWYPEAARLTALRGADLLVYPTAIGVLPEESEATAAEYLDAWQTIQRSHAIANGCFVASINRVGTEGDIRFWGSSFVAAPFGRVMAEAGGKEEVLQVAIDLDAIEQQRRTWPFFRDRRVESYNDITRRFID